MFGIERESIKTFYCGMKSVSPATVNPTITFVDEHGKTFKHNVPFTITNKIKSVLKATKFLQAWPVFVVMFGDDVVCVDFPSADRRKRHEEEGTTWQSPFVEKNLQRVLDKASDWSYDGQFMYKPSGKVKRANDSNFGTIVYDAFNLYKMRNEIYDQEQITGFAYYSAGTGWVVTPPLSKNAGEKFSLSEYRRSDDKEEQPPRDVEYINQYIFPNIKFVSFTAKEIANAFSFEEIEPLGVPLLMVEHQTFNIGKIPAAISYHSPAPLTYTQAIAWLTGMVQKVESLDQLKAIKSCLKMLMKKGSTRGEHGARASDVEQMRNHYSNMPNVKFGT